MRLWSSFLSRNLCEVKVSLKGSSKKKTLSCESCRGELYSSIVFVIGELVIL